MTFHPIPRDPSGRIILPGRLKTWDVDFSQVSALPSWLTATPGSGAVSIIAGELSIASGTDALLPASVAGPTALSTSVESIAFTTYGAYSVGTTSGQLVQMVSSMAAWEGNWGSGAQLHTPTGGNLVYLRGTVGDWPVTSSLVVDNNYSRSNARSTRTIVVLPSSGMVYAVEDETEVMHARDLSATMVSGTIGPVVAAKAHGGTERTFRCSRIKIQIGYRT